MFRAWNSNTTTTTASEHCRTCAIRCRCGARQPIGMEGCHWARALTAPACRGRCITPCETAWLGPSRRGGALPVSVYVYESHIMSDGGSGCAHSCSASPGLNTSRISSWRTSTGGTATRSWSRPSSPSRHCIRNSPTHAATPTEHSAECGILHAWVGQIVTFFTYSSPITAPWAPPRLLSPGWSPTRLGAALGHSGKPLRQCAVAARA